MKDQEKTEIQDESSTKKDKILMVVSIIAFIIFTAVVLYLQATGRYDFRDALKPIMPRPIQPPIPIEDLLA